MAPGPVTTLPPVQGLPAGAPQPMPGESKSAYQTRLNKWLNDFVHGKVGGILPSVPNPVSGVENAVGVLTNANTWIRVAEFVVGAILITVGLSKMTGTSGTVKKAAKAAVL